MLDAKFGETKVSRNTTIRIHPPDLLLLVQTDKKIYKPGQRGTLCLSKTYLCTSFSDERCSKKVRSYFIKYTVMVLTYCSSEKHQEVPHYGEDSLVDARTVLIMPIIWRKLEYPSFMFSHRYLLMLHRLIPRSWSKLRNVMYDFASVNKNHTLQYHSLFWY